MYLITLQRVSSLRLDDIQHFMLMIYRNKLRMIYKAYALIYLRKCDIIKQRKEAITLPSTNIWIMCVVMIVLSPISWFILDEYGIRYHLMRKILKKRWLYAAVTYSLLLSNLLLLLTALLFPNWWLYILGGIWIGTIGQFPPLNHGVRSIYLISYKGSYEIYVEQADLWEKNLKKKREKRMRRKNKRKSKKKC